MKENLNKLQGKVNKLSDKLDDHELEINNLRKFRHEANGHIHNHNGEISIIKTQQNNMETTLNKISTILEDAVKKITTLWTLKSMIIGGGIVFVPTVTAMFFLFQWYLKSRGMN